MPCYLVPMKDGGRMIMCGNLGEHCAECGNVSGFLCDYPVGDGKTCDRPMCEDHLNEIAPNLHYCAQHLQMYREFVASGRQVKALENVVPYSGILKPIVDEE